MGAEAQGSHALSDSALLYRRLSSIYAASQAAVIPD